MKNESTMANNVVLAREWLLELTTSDHTHSITSIVYIHSVNLNGFSTEWMSWRQTLNDNS